MANFSSGVDAVSDTLSKSVEHRALRKKYRDAIKNIDAESILDYYGAENRIDRGDEMIHSCLIDRVIPHHSNGDANPSASINAQSLTYNCLSFGGGSIWWFLNLMEDGNAGVQRVVSACLNDEVGEKRNLVEEIHKMLQGSAGVEQVPTYHQIVLRPWLGIHPWLTEVRGISPTVLQRYSVGYDPGKKRIVFPHFWEGRLVGWQSRTQDDPRWPKTEADIHPKTGKPYRPKYKNTPSFPKDETIYNMDTVKERGHRSVIVTESVMSVLKAETMLEETGVDFFGTTVATFSGYVTETQANLLKSFDEVIWWPDRDETGHQGSLLAYKRLSQSTKFYVVFPDDKRDLGDLDAATAIKQFNNKQFGFLAKARLEREQWQ